MQIMTDPVKHMCYDMEAQLFIGRT